MLNPSGGRQWINPSKRLVDKAIDRWVSNNLRADNTSVVTGMSQLTRFRYTTAYLLCFTYLMCCKGKFDTKIFRAISLEGLQIVFLYAIFILKYVWKNDIDMKRDHDIYRINIFPYKDRVDFTKFFERDRGLQYFSIL